MTSPLDLRPAPPAAASASARALRAGSSLHGLDYEIIGVVHDGRYGINYLARDRVHSQRVVIKEYLPSQLAWRAPGGSGVVTKAARHDLAFKAGLRAFTNEARLLASFEHPAIVRILRCWKEHGTAYLTMPVYDGATLRRVITERGAAPDEAELRAWLRPLLDGLEALHTANCVHGDITPDSLLITSDGPVLLGFGSGRHAIGQALRTPDEVLTPGYAAPEQYHPDPAPLLGAWTDLYALAAVLCAAMTGRAPTAAPDRVRHDDLELVADQVGTRYTDSLSAAVDAALAIPAIDRPQTAAAFRALLSGVATDTPSARRRSGTARSPVRVDRFGALLIASAVLCLAAFAVIGVLLLRTPAAPSASGSAPVKAAVPLATPVSVPVPDPMASPAATPSLTLTPPITSSAPVAPKAAAPASKPLADKPLANTAGVAAPAAIAAAKPSAECSELTQRASLQTLAPEESQQLKKECKR